MIDPTWVEILKPLGVAAPFIVYLVWKERETTVERKLLTGEFIRALEKTIAATNETTIEARSAIEQMADAVTKSAAQHSQDHREILNALIAARREPRLVGAPKEE